MPRLHRFAYRLVIITLFLLPFHAFGSVVLNYGIGLSEIFGNTMIINAWKEMILALLTIVLLAQWLIEYSNIRATSSSCFKAIPKLIRWDFLDSIIVAYLVFGLVHSVLLKFGVFGQDQAALPLSQFIIGAKYDYLFLYAFLLIKHLNFSEEEFSRMLKTALLSGLLSLTAAYVFYFIIKPENLIIFGFRNDWSTWLPNQALAFCQKIEHQNLCRMSGTFAGPNQFGAYLTVLLSLVLLWLKNRKTFFESGVQNLKILLRSKYTIFFILLMLGGALALTFSRGAWIAAAINIICLLYFQSRFRKHFLKIMLSLGVVAAIATSLLFFFDLKLITRPGSTGGHIQAWLMGINEMKAHPFGQGLGTSGPASSYFSHPLIPENWYFQVGIELGFIGLGLFILALLAIVHKLIQVREFYLLSALIGIMTIAFFLHTFEDAPLSLTLFILLGARLGSSFKESSPQAS